MNTPQPRILIVDDVPANIDLLADFLVGEYDITIATSGPEAIRSAETLAPDLILLDVAMPEMDGYETCRRLKANPDTRNIPIIFVTARDDETNEKQGLELGAADYITKPVRPAIVQVRVRLHLENRRQREALERIACTDALTRVANRARFDEVLEREWGRSLRSSLGISLILLDIDHFKKYNDHYGHCAGD
nr:response regulator [Magnetococcales bacterium]